MNHHRMDMITINILKHDVEGKRVLEVGSRNVNGSVRPYIESLQPAEYIGVDIIDGPGVDRICDIADLIECYGEESFDMVISTETIEHVDNWREAVRNVHGVLKPKGRLIMTMPTVGTPYHGHPNDYWRFKKVDLIIIFNPEKLEYVEKDGIYMNTKKKSLGEYSNLHIYSILRGTYIHHHTWYDYVIMRQYRLFEIWFRKAMVRLLPRPVKNLLTRMNIK